MQFKTINYGVTTKIGDDYVKAGAEADIFPGEKFEDCVTELKAAVSSMVESGNPKPAKKEPKKEEKPATTRSSSRTKKEEPKKEEEETETVEEVKPKPRARRSAKPKTVVYDRKKHKQMFADLLDEKFPTWKKDKEILANAGDASKALVGVDFLDSNGDILESFIDEVVSRVDGGL